MSFSAPLRIVPTLTPTTVRVIYLAHAALVALLVGWWPWSWSSVGLAGTIALSALATVREIAYLPRHFAAALLDAQSAWVLTTADGVRHSAASAGRPVLAPGIMLVPLIVERRARTLLITRATVTPDQWRHLTVRLKFASATPATVA